MTLKHIGIRILELRESKGMSQDDLAKAIGKSKSLISFIEKTGKVNDRTLKEISNHLKVSFENLKLSPILDLDAQEKEMDELKSKLTILEKENGLLKSLIQKQDKIIALLEESRK